MHTIQSKSPGVIINGLKMMFHLSIEASLEQSLRQLIAPSFEATIAIITSDPLIETDCGGRRWQKRNLRSLLDMSQYSDNLFFKVEKLLANFIKFQDATGACCYRDGRTQTDIGQLHNMPNDAKCQVYQMSWSLSRCQDLFRWDDHRHIQTSSLIFPS